MFSDDFTTFDDFI
jgi:hypothetical protein